MARPHREPAVAEFRQNLADRTFMQRDAEASLQLIAQVHPTPTNNPMSRWIRASLDKRSQFSLLIRRQSRLRTHWLA
jgi:hypothetical protein